MPRGKTRVTKKEIKRDSKREENAFKARKGEKAAIKGRNALKSLRRIVIVEQIEAGGSRISRMSPIVFMKFVTLGYGRFPSSLLPACEVIKRSSGTTPGCYRSSRPQTA